MLALCLVVFFVVFNGVFPMGPGAIGLLGAPVMAIAVAGGLLSPGWTMIALAVAAGATFLLPISPIYLITYDKGYFTFGDVIKSGILPSVGVIIACMVVVLPLTSVLGL
jgi:sodium-dependent dicarboxylate transporter 2/3/5